MEIDLSVVYTTECLGSRYREVRHVNNRVNPRNESLRGIIRIEGAGHNISPGTSRKICRDDLMRLAKAFNQNPPDFRSG